MECEEKREEVGGAGSFLRASWSFHAQRCTQNQRGISHWLPQLRRNCRQNNGLVLFFLALLCEEWYNEGKFLSHLHATQNITYRDDWLPAWVMVWKNRNTHITLKRQVPNTVRQWWLRKETLSNRKYPLTLCLVIGFGNWRVFKGHTTLVKKIDMS